MREGEEGTSGERQVWHTKRITWIETNDFLLVYEMLINHIKLDKKSIVPSTRNRTCNRENGYFVDVVVLVVVDFIVHFHFSVALVVLQLT